MDQYRGQSCCSCCPYQQRNRRGIHCGQTLADYASSKCPVCKCKHPNKYGKNKPYLSACPQFEGMNYNEQRNLVNKLKYCLVCLRTKNYQNHSNPCKKTEFYCNFCPDPINKFHRSWYCHNRPDDYSATPAGNKGGKGGENDGKGKNIGTKEVVSWTHKLLPHPADCRKKQQRCKN